MPVFPISHRWSAKPIAVVEAETYQEALELAVRRGVGMVYADLKGIDVPRAFLGGADLRGADLSRAELLAVNLHKADLRTAKLVGTVLQRACLCEADLRHADLRGADLRHANLKGARLVGADLRGALLTGAKLEGAILDWRWSVVAVELLRSHRGNSGEAFRVVADLAFEDDSHPYAWLKVLIRHGSQADWVLSVLSQYLRPGDNAPELLRRLAADLPADARQAITPSSSGAEHGDPEPCLSADAPATLPMLWTRRAAREGPIILTQTHGR
jgi:hypothetical protein